MTASLELPISWFIKLELRTEQNRDAYCEARYLAESGRGLKWAAGSLLIEDAKYQRKEKWTGYTQIIKYSFFSRRIS